MYGLTFTGMLFAPVGGIAFDGFASSVKPYKLLVPLSGPSTTINPA